MIALVALGFKGLNLGLDFTGGMVTEVKVDKQLTNHDLLDVLQPKLGESTSVTRSGEDGRWVIRYSAPEEGQTLPSVADVLKPISHQVDVVSNSIVGAQVGQDLFEQGGLALLICVLSILGYLCFRFEWRLASGSLFALAHDVILVLGFFAITQMEFNLTVFAAVLAILGYSLNDSIIIADRIRELLIAKQSWKTEDINDQAVIATFHAPCDIWYNTDHRWSIVDYGRSAFGWFLNRDVYWRSVWYMVIDFDWYRAARVVETGAETLSAC